MTTAIIIVSYKTPWHLSKCLESVFKHTSNFHIFLVFNSKDSESLKVGLKYKDKYPDQITLTQNERNLGFVGGVNSVYDQAVKFERVCLLNSDTIVTKKWLIDLNEVLDNPDIVQVSPDSNSYYNDRSWWKYVKLLPSFISKYSYLQLKSKTLPTSDYDEHFKEKRFYEYDKFYKFCAGFCNVFKSEYFKDLGYFCDPNIIHGYWDDFDLSMYLRQFGKIGWTNRSFVFHFVNVSYNKISEEKKGMKENLNLLNGLYVMNKWIDKIKDQLPEARQDSYVSQMAFKYLRMLEEKEVTQEYIESIPAKEIGEAFLKN
ncbi:MAG: glycosyltransferase family 2 protein [Candidatus Dojkabacteria bacterium]